MEANLNPGTNAALSFPAPLSCTPVCRQPTNPGAKAARSFPAPLSCTPVYRHPLAGSLLPIYTLYGLAERAEQSQSCSTLRGVSAQRRSQQTTPSRRAALQAQAFTKAKLSGHLLDIEKGGWNLMWQTPNHRDQHGNCPWHTNTDPADQNTQRCLFRRSRELACCNESMNE